MGTADQSETLGGMEGAESTKRCKGTRRGTERGVEGHKWAVEGKGCGGVQGHGGHKRGMEECRGAQRAWRRHRRRYSRGTEGALRGAEGVWRVQRPWRGMEGWLPLAKS